MTSKKDTLKLIKEKVDGRTSGKIKLPKPFVVTIKEGIIKCTKRVKVATLIKQGNSVMWIDNNYAVRNINVLDIKDLHKIMWQIISDKEKREIALTHLLETKDYLSF